MLEVPPVITIDGPGGSGKGTMSRSLARRLGWNWLDSGALYRVVALAAQRSATGPSEECLAGLARTLNVRFWTAESAEEERIFLDGEDVSDVIRTEECGRKASQLARIPLLRAALLRRQRAFRKAPGLVADGRDMGTVVFPDAAVKLFLTAAPEERAKRRHKQLRGKGISVTLAELQKEITERDEQDRQRAVSPLRPAADAVTVDTTGLGIDAVLDRLAELVASGGILCDE
jgi:cytidylate kinase